VDWFSTIVRQAREQKLARFWFSVCESFAPVELASLEQGKRNHVIIQVTEFVEGQVSSLPLLLRLCFDLGVTCFQIFVLVTTLRPFEHHDLDSRRRICKSWAYGRFGIARKLFRPIRSLAIFAYYENPAVLGDTSERESVKRDVEEHDKLRGAMMQSPNTFEG
jgi:hypothetical protein